MAVVLDVVGFVFICVILSSGYAGTEDAKNPDKEEAAKAVKEEWGMGKKVKQHDWKSKQSRVVGFVWPDREHGYIRGVVHTPLGVVEVYSQEGCTTMGCIVGGFYHSRMVEIGHSDIGLARVAHKFIKEIANAT